MVWVGGAFTLQIYGMYTALWASGSDRPVWS